MSIPSPPLGRLAPCVGALVATGSFVALVVASSSPVSPNESGRWHGGQDRTVTIATDGTEPVRIEWLVLARDGTVSADRTATIAPGQRSIQVSIVPAANRFVSFRRAGSSPVTVGAIDLARARRWELPAIGAGGEIVVVFEPAAVVPIRIVMPSAANRVVAREDRFAVSMAGLEAGRHTWSPVYDGGIAGAVSAAIVTDGQTTFVRVPPANVGAVEIEPGGACDYYGEIGIYRLEPNENPNLTPARRRVAQVEAPWTCAGTIGGLAPGPYEAYVRGANGTVRTARVDVVEQSVVRATVAEALYRVSGRVTLNDKPFSGKEIQFLRQGAPAINAARVEIDGGGSYTVDLPEPGEYRVNLFEGRMAIPGRRSVVSVMEAYTIFDWKLQGGDLTVRLEGWQRQQSIRVQVLLTPESEDPGIGQVNTSRIVSVHDDNPFVIPAVPAGQLKVWATSAGNDEPYLTSAQETLTLSKDRPDDEVVLHLRDGGLTVRLFDGLGTPVSGAHLSSTVRADRPSQAVEVESGVYRLERTIPGFSFYIRAPALVPICRVVPGGREMEAVVAAGRAVQIRFSRPVRGQPPGEVAGLAGSECPVPLSLFDGNGLGGSPDGTWDRLVLRNFPSVGSPAFIWRSTGERQPMVVDSDGVIRITLPERQHERR